VLRDVAVFRRAYQLIGLGWLYAPTSWPLLAPLADRVYQLWALWRLPLTGRPGLEQLCAARGGSCCSQP
jgi:predicted DCC family thiol-disulfide oxidoreductase YuxK